MQNGASMYSNPCKAVNTAPKMIVVDREVLVFLIFPLSISWCAHVTVTPEDRRRIVFSSGILIGLNDLIETGGHLCPNSIVGEILLWKKAQKKEAKNKTSDRMNSTIPVFRPFITTSEWFPCHVDSR
jgi:hypothetical protein